MPDRSTAWLGRVGPWPILVLFAAIGVWFTMAPTPPPDAADSDFAADRAFTHVRAIATEPHPMGTPAIARARSYIVTELRAIGIEPDLQSATAPNYFGVGEPIEIVNIVARIPGTTSGGTIALIGHYDTVPSTPGANDNTAAVAALLETARALLSGPAVANDVLLIFTDAEEPAPRPGAKTFMTGHPAATEIDIAVNFEATGGSGASLLVETSGPEHWLVGEYARAVRHPAAFSFLPETVRLFGDVGTDFDVFRNAGIAGMHFAYVRGSSIYHTMRDNTEAVSLASLQHHGDNALGIARHFGDLDISSPPPSTTKVFFALRPLFVQYPVSATIPFALLALAALATGLWRTHNQSLRPVRATLAAAATTVGLIVAATGLWMMATALRPEMGVVEVYLYAIAIFALATTGLVSLQNRWGGRLPTGYSAMSVWAALAAVTALVARGFSYLFVWPVLIAGVMLLWQPRQAWERFARFSLVAAVTLLLLVPAIDTYVHMTSPRPGNPDSDLSAVFALPVILTLLAAALLRRFWPQPPRLGTPASGD